MTSRRLCALLICLAIGSLTYGVTTMFQKAEERGLFWDVNFYRGAADRYAAGSDPYLSDGSPTGYYYSMTLTPLLALVFRNFEAGPVYEGLMGLAIAAAIGLAIGAFYRTSAPFLLCCLYALSFGNGQAVYLFVSGNLAWLAGLLQAGSLFAASRGKWKLFYLLVGGAALIKPYSLALLILPLAVEALSPWLALAVLPTGIDALLCHWLWPGMGQSRLMAIWMGIGEPLQLRYSLAGGISRVLVRAEIVDVATATAVAVAAQLALAMTLVFLLRMRRLSDPRRAVALAAVVACCAIPRLASYDAYVFGPALFFAFWPRPESMPITFSPDSPVPLLAIGLFKAALVFLPLFVLGWLLGEKYQTSSETPEALIAPSSGARGSPS